MSKQAALQRLLKPRQIAVFGGDEAAEVIRQCRRNGFAGDLWPVNPRRDSLAGLPCYRGVDDLPVAPDASFIAVPREASIGIVGQLAARGAGGAVCYASGFAEVGGIGIELQRELLAAAGDMALIGPNCYGLLNYLDGAALWPDQHGGAPVERGVALITQSGNIGISLTMQQRGLPIAYQIAVGNAADLALHDYIEALLDEPRVSAIGLHIEGLRDVQAFSVAAIAALRAAKPIVAIKAGSSALGAATALSHSSSLAGSDALYDALFRRLGIARAQDLSEFIETLKLLAIGGPIPGDGLASLSCSGGEASLVADLAESLDLPMPGVPQAQATTLRALLGERVSIANPLDYHTYIWGDFDALRDCFAAMLDGDFPISLLVLDYPKPGLCDLTHWETTERALIAAVAQTGRRAALVATLPENLPEAARQRLIAGGIAPLQGLREALLAVRSAQRIAAAQARVDEIRPLLPAPPLALPGTAKTLDEWHSKRALAEYGLAVPDSHLVGAAEAVAAADSLGYPVVVKAVSSELAHKTEAGGVALNLADADAVAAAVARMAALSDRFLVERMAAAPVAELIVGISRDASFGPALLIGAGGVLAELLADSQSLLLPVARADIEQAIARLRIAALLRGWRGAPSGDLPALIDAVLAVARYAEDHIETLLELDVNPLLVLPQNSAGGGGALAVDALIRQSVPGGDGTVTEDWKK